MFINFFIDNLIESTNYFEWTETNVLLYIVYIVRLYSLLWWKIFGVLLLFTNICTFCFFLFVVSEFAQELGTAMENHGANMRRLVDEFRTKSGESRGDAGSMRRVWENLLRQVEADASAHLDLAAVFQQQLSRPTVESSFHRKLQSRKVNGTREFSFPIKSFFLSEFQHFVGLRNTEEKRNQTYETCQGYLFFIYIIMLRIY